MWKSRWFAGTDLQDRLNLGRDVGLLVQLDALLVGPCRALRCDPLQVGQHHAVGLGHCLELVKQKLQQFQQQPAEGGRERGLEQESLCAFSPLRQLGLAEVPVERILWVILDCVPLLTGGKTSGLWTLMNSRSLYLF